MGGALRPCVYVKGVQKFVLSPKALGRVSFEHLLEEPIARPGGLQRAENPAGPIDLEEQAGKRIMRETHAS